MIFSTSLIQLLVVFYVRSIYSVGADETQVCTSTFTYEFDDNSYLPPVTFIIFSCNFIKNDPKLTYEENYPVIEKYPLPIDCTDLTSKINFNLANNSIILYPSSGKLPNIIHFQCSNPNSYISNYFSFHEQFLEDIVDNKQIQKAIIRKSELFVKRSKVLRSLVGSLDDFNDLIYSLEGCVACAILDYDLESMTSEELSQIFILFISYTQVIDSSLYRVQMNICDSYLILNAALKLLKNENFKEGYYMCKEYINDKFFYKYIESDFCFSQLEQYLIKRLDYINTCFQFTAIFYNSEEKLFSNCIESIKLVYLSYYENFDNKEVSWKHKSIKSDNGHQIEVNFTINSLLNVNYNYSTYNCRFYSNFIPEIKILLKHYSIYGDLPARFIVGGDYCKPEFKEQIELELYYKTGLIKIIEEVYNGMNSTYRLSDKSVTINFKAGIYIYSYYIKYINCKTIENDLCINCSEGFCLKNNRCYVCDGNCLYFDYNLKCLSCKNGYGFNSNNVCVSCIENCRLCDIFSKCLFCNSGYYLNSNNYCSPCKNYCIVCFFNYCSFYHEGYGKNIDNNPKSCSDSYCERCNSIYPCSVCRVGFYLNNINTTSDNPYPLYSPF